MWETLFLCFRLHHDGSSIAARRQRLSWDMGTDADLAGYEIVVRETTVDEWERIIPAGKVAKYTFKDFTIDNVFIGVRAVDKEGNRSPVRTPEERLP
jgi:hypothetical protein